MIRIHELSQMSCKGINFTIILNVESDYNVFFTYMERSAFIDMSVGALLSSMRTVFILFPSA